MTRQVGICNVCGEPIHLVVWNPPSYWVHTEMPGLRRNHLATPETGDSVIPSIGRIVHYHSYGTPGGEYQPEPRAAIVTAVPPRSDGSPGDGSVLSLAVLNPTGMFFNTAVPVAAAPTPGHWTWPPRVGE